MKTLRGTGLATLAGLVMMSSAMGGSPVVRVMVRDADGQARAACGRTSDRRVLYPQVVPQIARPGQPVQYLPAHSLCLLP